jgi:ectoine hydroxylase
MQDHYQSRNDGTCEIVERPDPVVWGRGSGPLEHADLEAFARDGFLLQEDLLTPGEADDLRRELARIMKRADPSNAEVISEPDSDEVRSVFLVHRTSEIFRRMAEDPRLVEPVRQLLGTDVYVHQSRVNLKPAAHGREFFWHSDFETWHVEDGMPRPRAVSASVALTDNTVFNGPLMVVPGSHRSFLRCAGQTPEDHYRSSLKRQVIGTPSVEGLRSLVERHGGLRAPLGRAGTVLFFECNLMHASPGNLSPYPRTNFFLVYNSVENRPRAPYGGGSPRPEFLAERHPTTIEPPHAAP